MPHTSGDAHGESPSLTTVYETGSIALLGLAKAVLDAGGIPFLAKNELTTDLMGGLRLGGAPSLFTGPMQLQVRTEDAPDARELLADIREGSTDLGT